MKAENHKPDIAVEKGLAISLGSAFLGHYTHLGFLTALEENGIRPGRIAGSSAGAIAGMLWCSGRRGEELERLIFSLYFKRRFFDFGALWRLPATLSWLWGNGILAGSRMERWLDREFGTGFRIEDLTGPRLEVAVTNLSQRRCDIIREGSLRDAVIASFSMPLLFRPRRVAGDECVDGGATDEAPYAHWFQEPEVETILVHRISFTEKPCPSRRLNTLGVIHLSYQAIIHEMEQLRVRLAQACGKKVIFLETRHEHPGLICNRRAKGNFQHGYDTGLEAVRRLREKETSVSDTAS
jgi:NTE family protein